MAKFKSGQSGNPGGRPKGSYVERCRQYADEHGWDFLDRIARGKERGMTHPRLRIEAAKLLIAYGYGKPRDHMSLGAEGDMPTRFTLELGQPLKPFEGMSREELLKVIEATDP